MKMEKEGFYFEEEADLANNETFGGDINDLNDDWELQHKLVSRLLEIEHNEMNSPPRERSEESCFHNSDEEEEVIIENSISQLGLDDEKEFMVRPHSSSKIEFEESKESWMSPPRTNNRNSIDELISPKSGIWASPSHDEQVVPSLQKKQSEDIIKKLFGGHDLKTARKDTDMPASKFILAEDLEKQLKPGNGHDSPTPSGLPMPVFGNIQQPLKSMNLGTPPSGLPWLRMDRNMGFPTPPRFPMDVNSMAAMMVQNKPMMQMPAGFNSPMPMMPRPPVLSLHILAQNPFLDDPIGMFKRGSPGGGGNHHHQGYRGNRGRGRGRYNSNYQRNERIWHKDEAEESFIKMESSQMMTAKEKEWIFKISLMSLLSGDSHISDYYFITYMNNKLLQKSQRDEKERKKSSSDEEELSDSLEKTKQLMNYANKHQQAKESYKPVKFEGSLGKLSITSVHHPRQIMDLSKTEQDHQTLTKLPDDGQKKFAMYGLVEKMYSIFLSLSDSARKLLDSSPEEQEAILAERTKKINSIFAMLKISYHNSTEESDVDHFLHLMSITKSRKFLPRVFLLFSQVQAESILAAFIHLLPALLKKDSKEKALLPLVDKSRIVLSKSKEMFKMKCIKMLRSVNLKMLLSYQMSIKLLTVLLNSLSIKDMSNDDWAYYYTEVATVSKGLSSELVTVNQMDLAKLLDLLSVAR